MSDDANDEPMDVTRRTALLAAGSVAGGAALTRSLAPLADWVPTIDAETYFQAHYKELSRADMDRILAHLEDKTLEEYGTEVDISDPRPIPGVKFAYAVNLSRCNAN